MVFFVVYLITLILVFCVVVKLQYRHSKILDPKVKKFGIVFNSNKKHKIKIGVDVKIFRIGNLTYLKKENKIVIIKNIKNVISKNEHMYFTANGEVKIIFDCLDFYRYFNVEIKSNYFDVKSIKRQTIQEMLNNLLDIENGLRFKNFLKFIKNTLKIEINNEKITIKPNNLKISYILTYKLNNKIKRINIKETI